MRKLMRESSQTQRAVEDYIKSIIDNFLIKHNIKFKSVQQYEVPIPDFGYVPTLDICYFIDSKKINIEIDGEYHESYQQEFNDRYRDARLNELGFKVYRIKEWAFEPLFKRTEYPKEIINSTIEKLENHLKIVFNIK
jgi:very-short-patch-repair endonuclease